MTQDLDVEYLPSLSIPDAGKIFESWKTRAAATRAELPFKANVRYGSHPREVMDFYPAENARGCVVFIHGGYWLEFSKVETSWVAKGFVGQGISVALINYPLCPEVTIGQIRTSCAKAFAHLYKNVFSVAERRAVVVSGHSAGGYLAASHLVEDWGPHGLPVDPIVGIVALSGVFDVAPLIKTSLNTSLRLDDALAKALNLIAMQPRGVAKLLLAVGEQESAEFHRQSTDLSNSWAGLAPQLINVAGTNHFTILDELAAPSGALNRLAVAMAHS